jgi:hypothetical protein
MGCASLFVRRTCDGRRQLGSAGRIMACHAHAYGSCDVPRAARRSLRAPAQLRRRRQRSAATGRRLCLRGQHRLHRDRTGLSHVQGWILWPGGLPEQRGLPVGLGLRGAHRWPELLLSHLHRQVPVQSSSLGGRRSQLFVERDLRRRRVDPEGMCSAFCLNQDPSRLTMQLGQRAGER